MSTFCLVCNRGFNPFDFAFHLFGEEHRRLLIKLPIPIVNFDLNEIAYITPPVSPFAPPASPLECIPSTSSQSSFSSITFSPAMSPCEIEFSDSEFKCSTPKKLSPPKSPRWDDSLELGDPAYPPWRYYNCRFLKDDDGDKGPAAKRIRLD